MHFSSFLGSGGCFGMIMSQVPSWKCLAQKMLFRCSIQQDTASRTSLAWQSLWIHISAELQSQLWLVHPTDFHLCERYSNHWPQVGAGHSVADMPTDVTWHSVLLYCSLLCVSLLSLGLFFHLCHIFISVGSHIMCLSRSEHNGVLFPVALQAGQQQRQLVSLSASMAQQCHAIAWIQDGEHELSRSQSSDRFAKLQWNVEAMVKK